MVFWHCSGAQGVAIPSPLKLGLYVWEQARGYMCGSKLGVICVGGYMCVSKLGVM